MTTRAQRSRSLLDLVNVADRIGVHLSAAEYDSLIVLHGNSGELRRQIACPCVRIDTRSPDVGCINCKGLGRLYPEHMREPVIVLDSQRSATLKLTMSGHMVAGTVQLTFPSDVLPGFGDMFLPDHEEHVVEELLFRDGSQRAPDEQLRAHRVGPDQVRQSPSMRVERLTYPTPCCIENVAYRGDDGQIIHARPIAYTVDADGRWRWKPGYGPDPGGAWSVRYRAPAVYLVHTAEPVYRSEADQPMPRRVIAQRLDKVSSEDLRT